MTGMDSGMVFLRRSLVDFAKVQTLQVLGCLLPSAVFRYWGFFCSPPRSRGVVAARPTPAPPSAARGERLVVCPFALSFPVFGAVPRVVAALVLLVLHLEPLLANLKAVHVQDRLLCAAGVVKAHKPKPSRPPSVVVDHDPCRNHVPKRTKEVVQVEVGHLVGDVEHKQVAALGPVAVRHHLNGRARLVQHLGAFGRVAACSVGSPPAHSFHLARAYLPLPTRRRDRPRRRVHSQRRSPLLRS
mmetsp:Transcript_62706/g.107658  ORF Transcript_62706/g.107658 Transcript_62706/m.107658 type:complete len:243 (+) Transcript_62706:254-982(+)